MAVEATNNNNSVNPLYTTAAGTAIGGAGGYFGTKAILDSSVKKAMESADSFSKSKKAPEILSTLASGAKDKLKAAQDEFAAKFKQFFKTETGKDFPLEIAPDAAKEILESEEYLRQNSAQNLDALLADTKFAGNTLQDLEKAAAKTREQELLEKILAKQKNILSSAGYEVPFPASMIIDTVNVRAKDILKQHAAEIESSSGEKIENLIEVARAGDSKAMSYLQPIVEKCQKFVTNNEFGGAINEDIIRGMVLGKYDALQKQIAEETVEMLRQAGYEGDLDALRRAAKKTPAQELFETIEANTRHLKICEQTKPAAQAVVDMEATSEALESASKASDAAGIETYIKGIWGNIKDSAESAYKTLNKKTIRMAGILGAAGLGLAGYMIAKSKNSDK